MGKNQLRTCGSKDSLCLTWTLVLPVFWQTWCLRRRSDVAIASEPALWRAALAGRRGKAAKRRRWRKKRAAFEEMPRLAAPNRGREPERHDGGQFRFSPAAVGWLLHCRSGGKGLFRAPMRVTFVSNAGLGAWPTVTPSLGSPSGGAVGEADGRGIRQGPLPPPPGAPPPQGEAFGRIYRRGAAAAGPGGSQVCTAP